jgi:integrase
MARTRITEALVRRLLADPPAKDTTVFDVVLQRFALRAKPVRAQGEAPTAWYFVRYTTAGGRDRRIKIGAPATMTVEEARKEARKRLAQVNGGRDPQDEKQRLRAQPTVRELADAYLISPEFAAKTTKTQASDRRRIELHILSRIGAEQITGVTAPVARRLHQQIIADERVNSRKRRLGGPGGARKVLRLLAAMLGWGVTHGVITAMPFNLRELKLGGDAMRDAVITAAEDYARLFTTMDTMVGDGTLRPAVRAFIVLAASTGLRRGEAQGLRWGQVDLQRRRITLGITKGRALGRRHGGDQGAEMVGLPPIAAAALSALRPADATDGDIVFIPAKGAQLAVNDDWIRVRKATNLPANLTLHGLRHSVGTVGAINGMSMAELQALLRHRQPRTTSRYIHFASAAGGLADKAMANVLPAPDGPAAPVVPLRRGAGR